LSDNRSSDEQRRKLTARIAQEEQRISEFHTELEQRRALVFSFHERLTEIEKGTDRAQAPDEAASSMSAALGREEKVRLFRTLFRGREDVFPRRWESRKTGKSGYSPACANEWDSLLCAKKRGSGTARTASCVDCCQHAFFPVTDEEIEKHLKGFQVMGMYPLLFLMRLAGFLPRTSMMERGRKISHRSAKPAVHTTFPSRSSDRVSETALTLGSFSPGPFPPASQGIWGVS
jgi:hypothetical protein